MVLNMLIRTRKIVISSVIRPGITCESGLFHRRKGLKWLIHFLRDDHLWVDEEGYPADHNKEPAWEVVGDDVERHFPGQHELVIIMITGVTFIMIYQLQLAKTCPKILRYILC